MPKSKGMKYYAVRVGRGGPQIYNTWEEVRSQLSDRNSTVTDRAVSVPCAGDRRFQHKRDVWMLTSLNRSIGIPETGTNPFTA